MFQTEMEVETREKIRDTIGFSLKTKIALGEVNKKKTKTGENVAYYSYIKPLQMKGISSAIHRDTLTILPTGYGKSLIFEIIPYLLHSKIIIISPLNAIILEQVAKLGDSSLQIDTGLISDLNTGKTSSASKRFASGDVDFLIGHPEHVLNKSVCDVLCSDIYRGVSHIVIDEAHCVVTWGEEFRPHYKRLPKLRSIFPQAFVLALTATATIQMQKDILSCLQMNDAMTICRSIARDNIKLSVQNRPAATAQKITEIHDDLQHVLEPYVNELCDTIENFPKTIIYSKLKVCAFAYEMINREARKREDAQIIMASVAQYHAPSTEKMKEKVSKEVGDARGKVKLLLATEAYGMGADCSNIRRVIHIGPPNSLEVYMQEIGRAGRDGAQSHAILLYNANDVASNRKYLKEEVREYCKLNSCRRAFISNHFGFTTQNPEFCHDCCDVCEKPCNCDICFEKFLMDMEDKVDECVSVSSADKQSDEQHTHFRISLANALSVYFKQENEGLGYSTAEIYTGLNEKLAKKLAEQMHSIASEDDILVLFPGINCKYISDLFTIIKHFNDMKLQTP